MPQVIKDVLKKSEVLKFNKALAVAAHASDPEKALESIWNEALEGYLRAIVKNNGDVTRTYPHNTDGLVRVRLKQMGLMLNGLSVGKDLDILIEVKRNMNFSGTSGKPHRARVIAQVIHYLKAFKDAGDPIPQVTLVADMDEAFAVPTKILLEYLEKDYDWTVAPSAAADRDFALYSDLLEDHNLHSIYVENTQQESFDLEAFLSRVRSLAEDSKNFTKVRVDHHSLEKAFLEFQASVFGGLTNDTKTQMSIFVKSLLGDETIYLHPMRKNVIVIEYKDHKGSIKSTHYPPNSKFLFNSAAYETFFTKYDRSGYSIDEQKAITEIGDTLFEEFDRRFTGDFWTPKIWVDEAHRMIEKQLGEDWKEKYVVWDAACGSKNLTRDYKFKELYCSTLHQEELNIAEDYNKEATSFQYDFLNDDVDIHAASAGLGLGIEGRDWKMPDGLIKALKENKPFVFLMNPPYGQATSGQASEAKTGISNTGVKKSMKGYGHAALELYTQFIYRVQLFARAFNYTENMHFFFFFNKGFLTSPAFGRFTENLCNEFRFQSGFMLNAGEFSGTSSAWGIIFSGWEVGGEKNQDIRFDVLERSGTQIVKSSEWAAMMGVKKEKVIDKFIPRSKDYIEGFPISPNGFTAPSAEKTGMCSQMTRDAIGYIQGFPANVQQSDKYLAIGSFANYRGHGTAVTKNNFTHASIMLSVRKSWHAIISDQNLLWVRDKDVFPAPSEDFQNSGKDWENFTNDCVVYSLFANGSNQTSLRNYEYGENEDGSPRKWRINNEFFWLSKDRIRELSIENKLIEVERDLDTDSDRYVYKYLNERFDQLSEEAKKLLEVTSKVVEVSMKYRKAFNYEHPKYNLLSWDAGWAQLHRLCFGRDALPAAKNDPELQELRKEHAAALRAIGDKIAKRYSEDTGF